MQNDEIFIAVDEKAGLTSDQKVYVQLISTDFHSLFNLFLVFVITLSQKRQVNLQENWKPWKFESVKKDACDNYGFEDFLLSNFRAGDKFHNITVVT